MTKLFAFLFCILTILCPYLGYGKDTTIERSKELLNRGRYIEVIRLLNNYRPQIEDLSDYHYTLAKAFERKVATSQKDQIEASSAMSNDYIEHLRLAYIYSPKEKRSGLLLERAEAYMRIGYYSEASLIFKIYLRNYAGSDASQETVRAYIGLGDALYNLGSYDEAAHYFSKGGNELAALYGVAKSLQASGKIKEADEAFNKAIQMDRDFLERILKSQIQWSLPIDETLYRFAENRTMTNRPDEARNYLKMIKDKRLKAKADLLLGIISSREKKYDEALRYLDSAFSKGDRDTKKKAIYQIAEIYMIKGKDKEAETRLVELRHNYPFGKVYDDALLSLARLYRKSGNTDKAMPLLKELVFKRSPDRRAIDEFESIILATAEKDREGLIKLWNSVGPWLLETSRSETLIRVAQSLREAGTPFLRLANWLIKHGDSQIKDRAALLLADFYAYYGEPDRAEEYLKLLRSKIMRDSDEFHRIKARISLFSSNSGDAMNHILSIKDLRQEDIDLAGRVIYSMKGEKDLKRLVKQYRMAIDKGDTGDIVKLADILYSLGQRDEALYYYKKAIEKRNDKMSVQTEIDWASYRINTMTKDEKALSMIKEGRLKRLGELHLREEEIDNTIREVF